MPSRLRRSEASWWCFGGAAEVALPPGARDILRAMLENVEFVYQAADAFNLFLSEAEAFEAAGPLE